MVALSAIAALGSAAVGAVGSAIQNKKAKDLIQQQRNDNRNWYNTRMSEDYTSRVDSQAVINKQRELLQQQAENARGRNLVAGGSPEAEAIEKAQANSSLAQTMSDISAQGAAYKDRVEQQYRQQDAQLNQQQAQIHSNQAQAIAQAASQAVDSAVVHGANMKYLGGTDKPVRNPNAVQADNLDVANKALAQASAQQSQKNLDATIRNSIFKGIR